MIVEASGSVTGLLVPGLTRMQITVFVIMPSTSQLSYNHISLDQFIPGDPNLCSAWFIVHSMLSSNILLSTLVIGESSHITDPVQIIINWSLPIRALYCDEVKSV